EGAWGGAAGDAGRSGRLGGLASPASEKERSRAPHAIDRRIVGPPAGHPGPAVECVLTDAGPRVVPRPERRGYGGFIDTGRVDSRTGWGVCPTLVEASRSTLRAARASRGTLCGARAGPGRPR